MPGPRIRRQQALAPLDDHRPRALEVALEVERGVDVDSMLDDRTPGGLGLYLVAKMVDSIHYEYRNRTSKITFTKRSGSGEEGENV